MSNQQQQQQQGMTKRDYHAHWENHLRDLRRRLRNPEEFPDLTQNTLSRVRFYIGEMEKVLREMRNYQKDDVNWCRLGHNLVTLHEFLILTRMFVRCQGCMSAHNIAITEIFERDFLERCVQNPRYEGNHYYPTNLLKRLR